MIVDCLRPDHLGCYGYSRDTSPCIDAIASTATRFENAYAQSNWTYPSVYAMLTGRYPTVLGVNWFDQKVHGGFAVLPEQLKALGYHTSIFSSFKVLLNKNSFCGHFDEMREVRVDENAFEEWDRWLRGQKNAFLFFHIGEYVHEPYCASDRLVREVAGEDGISHQAVQSHAIQALTTRTTQGNTLRGLVGKINKGLIPLTADQIDYLIARYDAGIRHIDHIVGRLHDALNSRGEDYLFILTADHGQAFMEHGYICHGLSLYNEVIRVPLIVDDGQHHKGSVDTAVQLMDLYPTILECLDVKGDADIDGVSFWDGVIRQRTSGRTILAEGFPHVGMIRDRYKIISSYAKYWRFKMLYRQFMRHGKTMSWKRMAYSYLDRFRRGMLFDLDTDAMERNNIAGNQKDIYRDFCLDLGGMLETLLQKSQPPERVLLDKEIEEQLVKLGYL